MYKTCSHKAQKGIDSIRRDYRGMTNEELTSELKKRYQSFLELNEGDVVKGIVVGSDRHGIYVRLTQDNLCGFIKKEDLKNRKPQHHQKVIVVVVKKGYNNKGRIFVDCSLKCHAA